MNRGAVSLVSHLKNPIDRTLDFTNNLPEERNLLLFCNSEDCNELEGNTHISFKLEPSLLLNENEHAHISLHSAEVPYSFYGITETNNVLQYYESEGDYITNIQALKTITIPPGNYSIRNLILEIKTFMNTNTTNGSVYEISYSIIKNKITFSTVTANRGVRFLFDCDNSIAEHLGFSYSDEVYFNNSNPLTSDKVIRIFLLSNLYFRLANLSFVTNFATQYGSCYISDCIAKIPINAPPNDVIHYAPMIHVKNRIENKSINMLEVKLTNIYGELINLNGVRWSFSLILNIEKVKNNEV